jgi:hypothetical protein
MKLMIFTPTWTKPDGSDAIHPDCRRSVEAQRVNGEIEWVIGRDNPFGVGDLRNVAHQYAQARAQFLRSDAEALLTVEHDMVLPDGAAQKLIDTPADVVYGVYQLRHDTLVINAWRYENDVNLGMSLSRYPAELDQARRDGVARVSGVGHGCTLFRRHVLEKIAFRAGDAANVAPDIPFAEDALRAGFVSMARFDVEVIHMDGDQALTPYQTSERAMYIARETVNAIDGEGRFTRLIEGEVIKLTVAQARPLVAAGYLNVPDYLAFAFEAKPEEAEEVMQTVGVSVQLDGQAVGESQVSIPKRKRSK